MYNIWFIFRVQKKKKKYGFREKNPRFSVPLEILWNPEKEDTESVHLALGKAQER